MRYYYLLPALPPLSLHAPPEMTFKELKDLLFLNLSPEDFEILRMRRDRRTWEEVSLTLCLEVAACQMRLKRLIDREPVLAELVPTLKGKRLRRERRGG